ncbi:MAG: GNAT family N-acetyltransferase [Pseudomonadota bacterium]
MSEASPVCQIVEYDPSCMQNMLRDLAASWGGNDSASHFYDFWQSVITEPEKRMEVVLLAIQGDQAVGIGFANWRPYRDEGSRSVVYLVPDDCQKKGVGTALKNGMDAAFRQRGLTHQVAMLSEKSIDTAGFFEKTGFAPEEDVVRLEWKGDLYSYKEVPGLTLHFYDHSCLNDKVNDELAEFYNRAYANEGLCTRFTGEHIRRLITDDDAWMLYARDDATGQIAAYTECTNTPLFSGIAVLRPWWGTGLAEWIGGYTVDLYRERGFDSLWCIARRSNAASIRLQKRMGWHVTGPCPHYIAKVPD